jgi:outer membrane protein assembly factor BamB
MKLTKAFLFALVFGSIVLADDWPQWRGLNRDGISKERGLKSSWPEDGPPKLWKANVGAGWSSAAVVRNRVYTMGNVNDADHVVCLDSADGKIIWKHTYPCAYKEQMANVVLWCTPTVDGDRVYTVSREGHLFCLNAADGKVIWSKEFQKEFNAKPPAWGWVGSPLIEGDLLIAEVGGRGSAVVAFDKKSGRVVWKNGDSKPGYSSPVGYIRKSERDVLVFSALGLEARRVKDGAPLWKFPWKTSFDVNAAAPIVVGDRIFVSSAYGVGGAVLDISGAEPTVLWQNKKIRIQMGGAVYWGGHLYGFDESELKCVAFETGDVKWSERKFGKGSLIVADGKLIVYGGSGQLGVVEANPKSYQELAYAQVLEGHDTWAPPAFANGFIYLRSNETLAAFDVRGGENLTEKWIPLFTEEGIPKGWRVREWSDIRRPGPEGAKWIVKNGILNGSEPRGTWLVSEKEFGDFELEFEWKLGRRGNSGCGLRFPDYGDPAFDGMELQMVDPRYYPPEMKVPHSELTGSIYRVVAPSAQLFKPEDWNKYRVRLVGPKVHVELNGQAILDFNTADYTNKVKRHNDEDADPLKDRPTKGHLGFQELSREGGHVQIRNARLRVLD